MERIIQRYIMSLLEWQETKLKCINLGWTNSKEIKIEIELIEQCKKYLKNKFKKEGNK